MIFIVVCLSATSASKLLKNKIVAKTIPTDNNIDPHNLFDDLLPCSTQISFWAHGFPALLLEYLSLKYTRFKNKSISIPEKKNNNHDIM